MNLVLIGAPGAGKGTQSKYLRDKYNLSPMATGDLLRQAIASATPLGKKIAAVVNEGNLVDDTTVIELIDESLSEEGCFLFDGFPRTLAQADALDELLTSRSMSLRGALFLDISDDEVVNRLRQRGRSDDEEEVIHHRLKTYHAKTAPLRAYYESSGVGVSVSGMGSVNEVRERLCHTIDALRD